MDIACPNCAAMYRVPDALIDGANALRCVACGHAWVPAPPVTAAPELPPLPPEAPALPPEPAPTPEPPPLPVAPPPVLPVPPPPPPDHGAPVEPGPADPAPPAEPPPARPAPPPMQSDVTLSLKATRAGPPGLARRRPSEGARHRSAGGRMLSLAWIVSIALVVTLVLGLVVYGSELAAAWPPFARLAG